MERLAKRRPHRKIQRKIISDPSTWNRKCVQEVSCGLPAPPQGASQGRDPTRLCLKHMALNRMALVSAPVTIVAHLEADSTFNADTAPGKGYSRLALS